MVWGFGSGLNVVDIITDDNSFKINNANLTIDGDADTSVIFRVESHQIMEVSQSNLLLAGDIGDHNVLWYVDGPIGTGSFTFNNVTFQGMSLWDLNSSGDPIGDSDRNIAVFNNVQFCGQVVADEVNFQNTSGSSCSFDVSAVPVPAAVWLFGSGLIGLVGIAGKKKIS